MSRSIIQLYFDPFKGVHGLRFGSPETFLAKEKSFAKLRTGTYLVAFNAILVPDRSLSIISLENKTNPDMHSECGPIQRILITDSI